MKVYDELKNEIDALNEVMNTMVKKKVTMSSMADYLNGIRIAYGFVNVEMERFFLNHLTNHPLYGKLYINENGIIDF